MLIDQACTTQAVEAVPFSQRSWRLMRCFRAAMKLRIVGIRPVKNSRRKARRFHGPKERTSGISFHGSSLITTVSALTGWLKNSVLRCSFSIDLVVICRASSGRTVIFQSPWEAGDKFFSEAGATLPGDMMN